MQPDFGTGLHGLLFEQMDDEELSVAIQNTITENVNYWLPYISIRDIDVIMTDELKDRNQADLKITFTVGDEIELGEITFTVNG
jgi:phage baseplate assembly protein W